jgi:hypothetical protein
MSTTPASAATNSFIDHVTVESAPGHPYGYTARVYATAYVRNGGRAPGSAVWYWTVQMTPAWYRNTMANYPGMQDQLLCHLAFATSKTSYNLDDWRPSVGYAATVNAKCNPGGGGTIWD